MINYFYCGLLILFSFSVLQAQVTTQPSSIKEIHPETEFFKFFDNKSYLIEDQELKPGTIETIKGSITHTVILDDKINAELGSFQFDVMEKLSGKKYTGIGNIEINEKPLNDFSQSRDADPSHFSAWFRNKLPPEQSYYEYLESALENPATKYVSLGSWFFIPSKSNQGKIAYEIGLFAIGKQLTQRDLVEPIFQNKGMYSGFSNFSIFQKTDTKDSNFKITTNMDMLFISFDWISKHLNFRYSADNFSDDLSNIPFSVTDEGVITAERVLANGKKINLRAQLYGPSGEELGGVFTLIEDEKVTQGAFALQN